VEVCGGSLGVVSVAVAVSARPWGPLEDLVKLKKRVLGQTPRPVTGNLEVESMESKFFSGAELEEFRIFRNSIPQKDSGYSQRT